MHLTIPIVFGVCIEVDVSRSLNQHWVALYSPGVTELLLHVAQVQLERMWSQKRKGEGQARRKLFGGAL
jgi:hypothetical protein